VEINAGFCVAMLNDQDVASYKLEKIQDRIYFICLAALILIMVVGWMTLIAFAAYTVFVKW
jgi:hypothetical protein